MNAGLARIFHERFDLDDDERIPRPYSHKNYGCHRVPGLCGRAVSFIRLFSEDMTQTLTLCDTVAIIVFLLIIVGKVFSTRFIIYSDSIVSVGLLLRNELHFYEISGYRRCGRCFVIEPKYEGDRKIRIDNSLENVKEIKSWIEEKFPDLSENALLTETTKTAATAVNSDTIADAGADAETQNLSQARMVAGALEIAGVAASMWVLFLPTPRHLSIIAAMMIPAIALIVVKLSGGRIHMAACDAYPRILMVFSIPAICLTFLKFPMLCYIIFAILLPVGALLALKLLDKRMPKVARSAKPKVGWAFCLPPLCLLFRMLSDYDIPEYTKIWLAAIVMSALVLTILQRWQKEFSIRKPSYVVPYGLCILAYCFAAIIFVNCLRDSSGTAVYEMEIAGSDYGMMNSRLPVPSHCLFLLDHSGNNLKWLTYDVPLVKVSAEFYDRISKDNSKRPADPY